MQKMVSWLRKSSSRKVHRVYADRLEQTNDKIKPQSPDEDAQLEDIVDEARVPPHPKHASSSINLSQIINRANGMQNRRSGGGGGPSGNMPIDVGALFRSLVVASWADRNDFVVRFRWSRFAYFFILHVLLELFLPVSGPLLHLCVPKMQLRNMGFSGCFSVTLFEFIVFFGVVAIIVNHWFLMPGADSDWSIVCVVCVAFILRIFVVSVRYGFTSDQRIHLIRVRKLSNYEISQEFLFGGWLKFDPQLAESYVQGAMRRQIIEDTAFCFTFIDSLSPDTKAKLQDYFYYQRNAFSLKTHVQQLQTSLRVISQQRNRSLFMKFMPNARPPSPSSTANMRVFRQYVTGTREMTGEEVAQSYRGLLVLRELLLRSLNTKSNFFRNIRAMGMLFTMMPYFLKCWLQKRYIPSLGQGIELLIFQVLGQMLVVPNLGFVVVGVFDLKRKLFLMKALTKLVSPDSASSLGFLAANLIPTMNVMHCQNYYNWLKARKVLLDVGRKFTERIFMYLGVELAAVLALLVLLILNFLQVTKVYIPPVLLAAGLFYGSFLLIILWRFLHIGAAVNATFDEHITLLLEMKLNIHTLNYMSCKELFTASLRTPFLIKIRQIINVTQCDRFEKQPKVIEAIDNIVGHLQHEKEANQLRFLGITMSYSLINTLYGFGLSLVVAFLASKFGVQ